MEKSAISGSFARAVGDETPVMECADGSPERDVVADKFCFLLSLRRLALAPERLVRVRDQPFYALYHQLVVGPSGLYLTELLKTLPGAAKLLLEELVRTFEAMPESDLWSDSSVADSEIEILTRPAWLRVRKLARSLLSVLSKNPNLLVQDAGGFATRFNSGIETDGAIVQESTLLPSEAFSASTLPDLVQELRIYLARRSEEFDDFLFAWDGFVHQGLYGGSWLRDVWGWPRRWLERGLFQSSLEFAEQFEEVRLAGGDWMHINLYGVVDRHLIVTFQAPAWFGRTPPERVPIRLTKDDEKPAWRLRG